jgi:hypothetical protein
MFNLHIEPKDYTIPENHNDVHCFKKVSEHLANGYHCLRIFIESHGKMSSVVQTHNMIKKDSSN